MPPAVVKVCNFCKAHAFSTIALDTYNKVKECFPSLIASAEAEVINTNRVTMIAEAYLAKFETLAENEKISLSMEKFANTQDTRLYYVKYEHQRNATHLNLGVRWILYTDLQSIKELEFSSACESSTARFNMLEKFINLRKDIIGIHTICEKKHDNTCHYYYPDDNNEPVTFESLISVTLNFVKKSKIRHSSAVAFLDELKINVLCLYSLAERGLENAKLAEQATCSTQGCYCDLLLHVDDDETFEDNIQQPLESENICYSSYCNNEAKYTVLAGKHRDKCSNIFHSNVDHDTQEFAGYFCNDCCIFYCRKGENYTIAMYLTRLESPYTIALTNPFV